MKVTDSIVTKINNGDPQGNLAEVLRNADEDDLRVLLAAVMLEGQCGEVKAGELCELLDISADALSSSVKYWRGAGLIARSGKKGAAKGEKDGPAKKGALESAHKGGKVQASEPPIYTTEQMAALLESRAVTADFINEAQRIYGKIFNQSETATVLRMIDYIGFDEECVLTLLSFYSGTEKRSLRYVEKVALEFYDEDITNIDTLREKLRRMENARSAEGKIRAMFGMGSRNLTTKEKKYISAWTEKMGFDTDMIRLAYDITVDNTHEATPAYTNAILERWFADGIDTPEKAMEQSARREEKKNGEDSKSFDNNDFYEAALKRTYGS